MHHFCCESVGPLSYYPTLLPLHCITQYTVGVDCDVLDTIEGGYIEYSQGTVYQSVATYNCHSGHLLNVVESDTRTCASDGTWNGSAPTCSSELNLVFVIP